MDAPTIASVTPSTATTAGGVVVSIVGQRFGTPHAPAPTGPTTYHPGIRVLFGSKPAKVFPISSTLVKVIAPPGLAGAVDIRIDNLDASDNPIPGEFVIRPAGFTFARPDPAIPSNLETVVAALVSFLRGHIHENVVTLTHVDYDDDAGDGRRVVAVPKLPAIILVGPTLVEDRFYATNEKRTVSDGTGGALLLRPPTTVSVRFDLVILAEVQTVLLSLAAEFARVFSRVPYLDAPRVRGGDPSDLVSYEITSTFDGQARIVSAPNLDNLRQAEGVILIHGVDLDDDPGVAGLSFPVSAAPAVPGVVVNPAAPNFTFVVEQAESP